MEDGDWEAYLDRIEDSNEEQFASMFFLALSLIFGFLFLWYDYLPMFLVKLMIPAWAYALLAILCVFASAFSISDDGNNGDLPIS